MTNNFCILNSAMAMALALMTPGICSATQNRINSQDAVSIIRGCSDHAKAKGQSHAIAVYDDGGSMVALLRMDGNTAGVTEFAMQKAAAVAHWRFATSDMQNAIKETPGFANAPRVVTVAGGIPVYSADGERYVGAVGVSGEAPQDDAACAEAGVKAAGFSPTRKPKSVS